MSQNKDRERISTRKPEAAEPVVETRVEPKNDWTKLGIEHGKLQSPSAHVVLLHAIYAGDGVKRRGLSTAGPVAQDYAKVATKTWSRLCDPRRLSIVTLLFILDSALLWIAVAALGVACLFLCKSRRTTWCWCDAKVLVRKEGSASGTTLVESESSALSAMTSANFTSPCSHNTSP